MIGKKNKIKRSLIAKMPVDNIVPHRLPRLKLGSAQNIRNINILKKMNEAKFANLRSRGVPMLAPDKPPTQKDIYFVHEPLRITIIIIPFGYPKQVCNFLKQIDTTTNKYNYDISVVVSDNTQAPDEEKMIEGGCRKVKNFSTKYNHNAQNLKLAATLNRSVDGLESDFIIYLCSMDCYIYHPDWLYQMISYMMEYNRYGSVVMGGTLFPFNNGFSDHSMNTHVQGGLMITYTKFFQTHKYDEANFPHVFMDTTHCRMLLSQGYSLLNIPKIKSFPNVGWTRPDHELCKKEKTFYIVHSYDCRPYLAELD